MGMADRMAMRMRMTMGVGVDVPVFMSVGVGGGWNHARSLYYNVTAVHQPALMAALSPSQ